MIVQFLYVVVFVFKFMPPSGGFFVSRGTFFMPCYHPIQAWRSRDKNDSGKRSLVFNVRDGYEDSPVVIPCGKCVGCRLERSRQWATRCMHEASLYDMNCFLTLTYNGEHLPEDNSIHVRELQLFWKRLRKAIPEHIRYFACGEYGSKFGRPHYHAVVFGWWPPDAQIHARTKNGDLLYTSQLLNDIWQNGFVIIGTVTFESCAYVARYIMKKQLGSNIDPERYVNLDTGEVKEKEFVIMSRKPGIGQEWIRLYAPEVLTNGWIYANGHKSQIPKYYKNQLEKLDEKKYLQLKGKSAKLAVSRERSYDQSPDRLHDREYLQQLKLQKLQRTVDDLQLLQQTSSYDELDENYS